MIVSMRKGATGVSTTAVVDRRGAGTGGIQVLPYTQVVATLTAPAPFETTAATPTTLRSGKEDAVEISGGASPVLTGMYTRGGIRKVGVGTGDTVRAP